ncbi:MAG: hypothetical protein FJW20_03035 [Acidimicrobiia bacterium]|nr:hypothetical protein [Acidimicrobiia bacterium]
MRGERRLNRGKEVEEEGGKRRQMRAAAAIDPASQTVLLPDKVAQRLEGEQRCGADREQEPREAGLERSGPQQKVKERLCEDLSA